MKNLKFNFLLLAVVVLGFASISNAWTGPTDAPPNGNVAAPLNSGITSQSKLGSLLLNTTTVNPFVTGLTVFGKTLLVNSGVGLKEVLRLQHTGSNVGDGPILKFTNQTNDGYGAEIGTVNTLGSPNYLNPALIFKVTNTGTTNLGEKMRIDGNGNVGIGKTPTLGKLDVAGSGFFSGVQIGQGSTGYYADSSNLALRVPASNGALYVQTPNGAQTLLGLSSASLGTPTVGKALVATDVNGTVTWGTAMNTPLKQNVCAWTDWFRQEGGSQNGVPILSSPVIAPVGNYIAGMDYKASTGGADGVVRFYYCSSN